MPLNTRNSGTVSTSTFQTSAGVLRLLTSILKALIKGSNSLSLKTSDENFLGKFVSEIQARFLEKSIII
jgi:hypothetical protein